MVPRVALALALVLGLAAGIWVLAGGDQPPGAPTAARVAGRTSTPSTSARAPTSGSRGDDPSAPAARRGRAIDPRKRAERDAMRARILEAIAARPAADDDDDDATASDRRRSPPRPEADPGAAPPGTLTDRSGDHGYLLEVMNRDLMPLADECYTLAREARPDLAGMLVLDLEILSDEEIGGVIDTIAPGAANELTDPGLLECVRESLLATTLPAPPKGGRDALSLSLRLEPDPPPAE